MATELRKTGISAIGDVPWSTHFCCFYETKQDLLDILVPYFKAGLESKEFCLWIISNSELITIEEAKGALGQAVSDLDRYLAEGRIELVSHDQWFLKGGAFDFHRVAHGFKEKLDEALARGYAGMRVNGSPAWLQTKDTKELREFEEECDHIFHNERIIASCTYPLGGSRADFLLDVARNHQFAIARREGNWEVLETPQLTQAKQEIKRLKEELEQRVVERTSELAVANEALSREIAERKQAEETLRKAEQRFRALVENSTDGIALINSEGATVYASPAFWLIFGLTMEEVQTLRLDLIHPDDQDKVLNAWNELRATPGKLISFQYRFRYKDGTWRWLDVNAHSLFSDPSVRALVVNFRDITERKRAEEKLNATTEQLRALSASVQAAKEEEGTRIAREIHDELGGALTSLKWDLESFEKVISEARDPSQRQMLREKVEAMLRLSETMIGAVRRISSELRPSVLDDLGLAEAIEWQARQFQARTGITCHCECSVGKVDLNQEQATTVFRIFQEALTNILRHAQATKVDIAMKEAAGEFVLTVSDNGRGITEDDKSRLQSLGLLGMRERAHMIGGAIDITGVEGKGTVVIVRVPISGRGKVLKGAL